MSSFFRLIMFSVWSKQEVDVKWRMFLEEFNQLDELNENFPPEA